MRANGIAEKKSDLFKITWKATEKAGTHAQLGTFPLLSRRLWFHCRVK